uniref:Integrase catalytic domain-containing protein n=1 Tax=Strongyloides papillosus TaxID=174720 RepID=A0A0N5C166_STREA
MDNKSNGTKVPPGESTQMMPKENTSNLIYDSVYANVTPDGRKKLNPMENSTIPAFGNFNDNSSTEKNGSPASGNVTPIMPKNNQFVKSPQTVIVQQKRKVGRPPKSAKSGVQTKKTVSSKMASASNVLKDSTNYDIQISQLRSEFEQNQKMMTTMMIELTKNMQSLMSQVHQINTVLLSDTIVQKHEMIQSVDSLRYDNQSISDNSSEQSYNQDIQSKCGYPTKQNLSSHNQPQLQHVGIGMNDNRLSKTYQIEKMIKPFRGENINGWISILEMYFNHFGISEDADKRFILMSKIDFQLYEDHIHEFKMMKTYVNLKEFLLNTFNNEVSVQNAEIEIKLMKKDKKITHHQDIERFAKKSLKLVKIAYTHMSEQQRLRKVAELLGASIANENIKLLLVRFQSNTIQNLICYTKQLHQTSHSSNGKNINRHFSNTNNDRSNISNIKFGSDGNNKVWQGTNNISNDQVSHSYNTKNKQHGFHNNRNNKRPAANYSSCNDERSNNEENKYVSSSSSETDSLD